jgi:hypothetical protein
LWKMSPSQALHPKPLPGGRGTSALESDGISDSEQDLLLIQLDFDGFSDKTVAAFSFWRPESE